MSLAGRRRQHRCQLASEALHLGPCGSVGKLRGYRCSDTGGAEAISLAPGVRALDTSSRTCGKRMKEALRTTFRKVLQVMSPGLTKLRVIMARSSHSTNKLLQFDESDRY